MRKNKTEAGPFGLVDGQPNVKEMDARSEAISNPSDQIWYRSRKIKVSSENCARWVALVREARRNPADGACCLRRCGREENLCRAWESARSDGRSRRRQNPHHPVCHGVRRCSRCSQQNRAALSKPQFRMSEHQRSRLPFGMNCFSLPSLFWEGPAEPGLIIR